MDEHRHIPDLHKLSIVIAMILLAYSTTAFISIPTQRIEIQLPGFLLALNLNFITVVAVVSAILAAAGTDWILAAHPHANPQSRWHHWLVPAFTAIAIGITLGTIPLGLAWWFVFGLSALLMAGVLISEYISADSEDLRYTFSVLGLNTVSYALFLIIVITIAGVGFRLYVLLAAIIPAVFLITLRTLFLRLAGRWLAGWAAGITLVITQLAAALFYLPLRPLQYGMILLGLLYGAISLATNLEERLSGNSLWIEPTLMSLCFIALSFILK